MTTINPVDTTSHESLLDASKIQDEIHVLGCGAIGSHIALSLVKLGFSNLILWDFDKVESHNVANQVYFNKHIDIPKVEALRQLIGEITDCWIPEENAINAKFGAARTDRLSGIVFLCVDSMDTRKEIFENYIRLKPAVKVMIECRMNPWDGRVYCINPLRKEENNFWLENSAYSDSDAEVPRSACGRNVSVGPTARMIAEMAVIQFMRWARKHLGQDDDIPLEKELIEYHHDWHLSSQ